MKVRITGFLLVVFSISMIAKSQQSSFIPVKINDNSVVLQRNNELLKVEFIAQTMVRVQYSPKNEFDGNGTIICLPQNKMALNILVEDNRNSVSLKSLWASLVMFTIFSLNVDFSFEMAS